MKTTYASFADGALASGALTDIFTPTDTGTVNIVKQCAICNPTGAPITTTLKVIARTAGTARTLVSGRSVAAGETYTTPEAINAVVETGGKLQLQGNGLEFYISGAKVVQ